MKNFQPIPALNNTISDFKSLLANETDAFTLAETLITLTVIGVVAALTIPTLMQTWKDKQYDTAKKKAMTSVANGYKLMIADNDGTASNLPLFECGDDFSCMSGIHKKFFSIASDKSKTHDGLAEKYTKNGDSTEEAGFKWDDVPYIFTTSDGMTYGYLAEGDAIRVVVDVNGEKAPNKICKDTYLLAVSANGSTIIDKETKEGETQDLCEILNNSIAQVSDTCSVSNPAVCTEADFDSMSDDEWHAIYSNLPKAGQWCSVNGDYGESCEKCSNISKDGQFVVMIPAGDDTSRGEALVHNANIDDYSGYCQ